MISFGPTLRSPHSPDERAYIPSVTKFYDFLVATLNCGDAGQEGELIQRWVMQKAGGYRLNTDFKEEKFDLGRMFGFAYGEKENGAVFSHMTVDVYKRQEQGCFMCRNGEIHV